MTFIADSFSCQENKGTHRAVSRFRTFERQVSRNGTRTCWVLKCDVRKFFANVDHSILSTILCSSIHDDDVLTLLNAIIGSFHASRAGVGLPLGNLTSQLFVNIYMNEFDQFMKHRIKAKWYICYCDDFVIFSENRHWLELLIPTICRFLSERLRLELHPSKVCIKTVASGVDFLGWVHFHDHRVPRTATKRRMLKRVQQHPFPETLTSYLGLLKHGNAKILRKRIIKEYYLNNPIE